MNTDNRSDDPFLPWDQVQRLREQAKLDLEEMLERQAAETEAIIPAS